MRWMRRGRQARPASAKPAILSLVLGARYWLVAVGLCAILFGAAVFFGPWGWFIAAIPVGAVGWQLRREHRIARYLKDAGDHPPGDLPTEQSRGE